MSRTLMAYEESGRIVRHDSWEAPKALEQLCCQWRCWERAQSMTGLCPCELLIQYQNRRNQTISTNSRLWEPLVYPLLFPHGTFGWGLSLDNEDLHNENNDSTVDTATLSWHIRGLLLHEACFKKFGYLANEYAIDMFCRVLNKHLNLIKSAQL